MKIKDINLLPIGPYSSGEQEAIQEANAVYEGLIRSVNPHMVVNRIKFQFPNIKVVAQQDPDGPTAVVFLDITSTKINSGEFDRLMVLVNTLGWYPSWMQVNKKRGGKFDSADASKTLETPRSKLVVQLEAKYDVEEVKLPSVLYHASPAKHGQKITTQGLVPRSKATSIVYPDRIYLAKDLDNLINVLIPHIADTKQLHDGWAVFQVVGLDKMVPPPRLFFDPLYPHGYYTMSNIPPSHLKLIKIVDA